MAIRLEKGQNTKLSLNNFHVGLGWDVREDNTSNDDFDLDVSAFMLNDTKKIPADEYLVFYNSENRLKVYLDGPKKGELVQPLDLDALMEHFNGLEYIVRSEQVNYNGIDLVYSEGGDDETMDINLSKIRDDIKEIVICVSIHDYANRRQNFGQVEKAYVRLYKPGQAEGEGDYIYDLSEDFSTCASVEFCRIYKKDGDWKIQALGVGHKGGLEELVAKFV